MIDFDALHAEIQAAYPDLVEIIDGQKVAHYIVQGDGTALSGKTDVATDQQLAAVLTDHNPHVVHIESDKGEIRATGEDDADITVTVRNPVGEIKPVDMEITLLVDGEDVTINIEQGSGGFILAGVLPGVIEIRPVFPPLGFPIAIQVIE